MGGIDDDDLRHFARAMVYANGHVNALSIARRAVEFQRRLGRTEREEWWTRVVDVLERFR